MRLGLSYNRAPVELHGGEGYYLPRKVARYEIKLLAKKKDMGQTAEVITSLDLAKRDNILPGLRQVQWDLVIVDEAHRMSWTPPSRKTSRYALGEQPVQFEWFFIEN